MKESHFLYAAGACLDCFDWRGEPRGPQAWNRFATDLYANDDGNESATRPWLRAWQRRVGHVLVLHGLSRIIEDPEAASLRSCGGEILALLGIGACEVSAAFPRPPPGEEHAGSQNCGPVRGDRSVKVTRGFVLV
jgi:hypothetical protein